MVESVLVASVLVALKVAAAAWQSSHSEALQIAVNLHCEKREGMWLAASTNSSAMGGSTRLAGRRGQ